MTFDRNVLDLAKVIHEARISFCWGGDKLSFIDPWPNLSDPVSLRSYSQYPIDYVEIAIAIAKKVLDYQATMNAEIKFGPEAKAVWDELEGE